MKSNNHFAKNFFSICAGIALVLCSLSLLFFSIQPSFAEEEIIEMPVPLNPMQGVGSAENFIPLGISGGYAYWIVFNVDAGYKFRKSAVNGNHWLNKTN